jgi:hypothetical protein
MIWTLYKGTHCFLKIKRGVTYSSYSFGEYLLLLLLISWGLHPKFCFCFVLKEVLWFAHHKFFWNIGHSPKKVIIPPIPRPPKGSKTNPIVNMQLSGFKILKKFPKPRAGGFSIKKKKPRPNKSSKNQEPPNTRYYEHTIIPPCFICRV